MNKILLCGAMGRMGREVANCAKEHGFEIAAGVDFSAAEGAGFPLYGGFTDAIREEADVIIDFSRAAALSPSLSFGPDTLEEMIRTADIGEDTVVYMDIGETELDWPGARLHFRTFCDLLLKKHVLLTSRIVPGGTHCEASWERQIPFFRPALLY